MRPTRIIASPTFPRKALAFDIKLDAGGASSSTMRRVPGAHGRGGRYSHLLQDVSAGDTLEDGQRSFAEQARRPFLDPSPDGELRFVVEFSSVAAETRQILLHQESSRVVNGLEVEQILELVDPVLPVSPGERLAASVAEPRWFVLLSGPYAGCILSATNPYVAGRASSEDRRTALPAEPEVCGWRLRQVAVFRVPAHAHRRCLRP